MTDNCNCFSDQLNRVKKHVELRIPDGATELNFEWDGYSFIIGGDYSPVNPKVNYSFRKKKNNGQPAKSLTKDSVSLLASYCCYCGRKLNPEGDNDE